MVSRKIHIGTFFVLLLAISCRNNDQQSPVQAADSASAAKSGQGIKAGKDSGSVRSSDSTGAASDPGTAGARSAVDKGSSIPKGKVTSHNSKKSANKSDSSNSKGSQSADPNASAAPAPSSTTNQPSNSIDLSKPFAPKYGLIPWDANENNITDFKNAFPDKQTLVRLNFDSDPDDQMQKEKSTISDALKKAGYKNISDQSRTFHPARIPKEIHYELQRDGSVVIWLPPQNQ